MLRILGSALALSLATAAVAADGVDGASFADLSDSPTLAYLGSGRPDLINRGNRNFIVVVAGEGFSARGSNGLFLRDQLDDRLSTRQAYSLSYTQTWIDDSGYSLKAPLSALAPTPISAAPVPEPGEWAMIVAGLGVVGFTAARRRRAAAA